MKTITRLTVTILFLLSFSFPIFAEGGGEPAVACCGIVWLIVMIVIAVVISVPVTIIILKWIKKDATIRGMPNAGTICWLALLGLLGLLIYVLTRPQGNVMPCQRCGQPRMLGLQLCPHCHQP